MNPIVRHCILCENYVTNPNPPHRLTFEGVMHAIKSLESVPFPLMHQGFCMYLMLTSCRGPAVGKITIEEADTGELILDGIPHHIHLPTDPLEVIGIPFRIRNLRFPSAGLYWVQFWYNSEMLSQQSLILR
jgi:hypothetical protein